MQYLPELSLLNPLIHLYITSGMIGLFAKMKGFIIFCSAAISPGSHSWDLGQAGLSSTSRISSRLLITSSKSGRAGVSVASLQTSSRHVSICLNHAINKKKFKLYHLMGVSRMLSMLRLSSNPLDPVFSLVSVISRL